MPKAQIFTTINMETLPIYTWRIDNLDEMDGVSFMSIVDAPAVEKDFIKYSKQRVDYSLDQEQQVITGVAIRADYPIYRNENGFEFYTIFEKDAIREIVCKFMKEQRNAMVNIDHNRGNLPDGVYLFESYILNDKHTLNIPEFEDVEAGSWIVSYKVENPEIWQQIKEGKLRGFSIEITGTLEQKDDLQYWRELYNLLNKIN